MACTLCYVFGPSAGTYSGSLCTWSPRADRGNHCVIRSIVVLLFVILGIFRSQFFHHRQDAIFVKLLPKKASKIKSCSFITAGPNVRESSGKPRTLSSSYLRLYKTHNNERRISQGIPFYILRDRSEFMTWEGGGFDPNGRPKTSTPPNNVGQILVPPIKSPTDN